MSEGVRDAQGHVAQEIGPSRDPRIGSAVSSPYLARGARESAQERFPWPTLCDLQPDRGSGNHRLDYKTDHAETASVCRTECGARLLRCRRTNVASLRLLWSVRSAVNGGELKRRPALHSGFQVPAIDSDPVLEPVAEPLGGWLAPRLASFDPVALNTAQCRPCSPSLRRGPSAANGKCPTALPRARTTSREWPVWRCGEAAPDASSASADA